MKTQTRPAVTVFHVELFGLKASPTEHSVRSGVEMSLAHMSVRKVKDDIHIFPGGGLTYIAILESSSIVVHTYPELKYMMVEVSCCGSVITGPAQVGSDLAKWFRAEAFEVETFRKPN